MYLYLIFGLLVIIAFLFDIVSQKRDGAYRAVFLGIIMLFFCISVCRWAVGPDWLSYLQHFQSIDNPAYQSYLSESFEPGYNLLTAINKQVVPYYTFHLCIVALIIYILVPVTILRFSTYPILSLLVWYSMVIAYIFPVRQNIAAVITLFSVRYIVERRKLLFLLFVAIASSFHYSALIFLPAYWLFHRYISGKQIIVLLLLTIGVSYFSIYVIQSILPFLENGMIGMKIGKYMEVADSHTGGSAYTKTSMLIRGIINRGFLILIIFLLNKYRKTDKLLNGWSNMAIWAFVLFSLTLPISVPLARVTMYYDLLQMFLIPCLFRLKVTRESKYLIYFVLTMYLFIRFKGVVFNYEELYIPYKSIFES